MQDARKTQLEDMIARTGLGDRDAFAALYEATSAKLHAICITMLKDRPEAEETLQEVYIKVWQNAERYAVNGLSPMTWLITIARNTSIDRLRSRGSTPPNTSEVDTMNVASSAPTAESNTIRAQERKMLDQCLSELAEPQARAVRAVYLEGMTYADLAKREDMALNTVRSWLRRSLLRLKECVNQ